MNTILVVFLSFFLLVASQHHAQTNPCSALGLSGEYDAIVVGSGPGGSVAARRLAEYDGGRLRVLQIERGIYYSECPQCQPADETLLAEDGGPDNILYTQPIPSIFNRTLYVVDHAVQGGGSSDNGMVWIRPDGPNYYKNFPPGWQWEDMIPYHIKIENYTFPDGFYGPGSSIHNFNYAANLRGNQGLIKVTQTDASYGSGFAGRFINASAGVMHGIPESLNNSLNNGWLRPSYGVTPMEHSWYEGKRSSAFPAYIESYTGNNLRAIAHVRVNRVLFEGNVVSGVEVIFLNQTTFQGYGQTCTIRAPTVVLSAGVYGTPKLLQLSGVGDAAFLRSLNIPLVSDVPNVGENMDDQFMVVFAGLPTSGGTPASPVDSYSLLFYNTEKNPTQPANMAMNAVNPTAGDAIPGFIAYTCYQKSRGTVQLATTNPDDPPIIIPRWLSNQTDYDNLAISLNQTLTTAFDMGVVLLVDPCAGKDCSTLNNQLAAYLTYTGAGILSSPGYHTTGTAGLNRVINPTTMGVYGTTGLYVLDSSALVLTPVGNTQNAVYALAEKGVELVIADAENNNCWE